MLSSQPPILDAAGEVDARLMVELVVSMFRLNPRHVTSYVFPLCMEDSADMVLKSVLITSLRILIVEGQRSVPRCLAALSRHLMRETESRYAWWPSLAISYKFVARSLRNLLQELLSKLDATSDRNAQAQLINNIVGLLFLATTNPQLVLEVGVAITLSLTHSLSVYVWVSIFC